jgi:hypothetical protein
MTKRFSPVVPSQLANELNEAFESAEARTICRAMGKALDNFNIQKSQEKPVCNERAFIEPSGTNGFQTFRLFLVCSRPWDWRSG